MVRKLFPVLMVLALLVSFIPAVVSAQDPAADTSWLKDWSGVKLTLSSHTGPTTDAYKVLAKDFEALTGAQVEIIDESWTDLLTKHMAAAAAHTGAYDVLTWPYVWFGHYVEGGMAENLDEWFAKTDLVDPNYDIEDFVPAILNAYGRYQTGFTPDPNILWSVPYKFDVYLAFYRTDLFEQAGIVDADGKAKPPETWDELLADAKILKEKFPDITPVAIPLIVDDPTVSTFLPIFVAYGGKSPMPWFDENLYPTFQGPEAVAAVEALKALMPYMPTDALDMDYDKVNAFMAQGQAAYGLNWNAYLPVLLDPEASKISDVVGFDLVPGGPAGRPQGSGWLADGHLHGFKEQGSFLPIVAVSNWQGPCGEARFGRWFGGSLFGSRESGNHQSVPLLPAVVEGGGERGSARHGPFMDRGADDHRNGRQRNTFGCGCPRNVVKGCSTGL